jgi:hypothetical protein
MLGRWSHELDQGIKEADTGNHGRKYELHQAGGLYCLMELTRIS